MKRGVSPLIATVLLIGLVIVLAALVIIFGNEVIVRQVEEVSFQEDQSIILSLDFQVTGIDFYEASYETVHFSVTNNQEKDIEAFYFRLYKGDVEIEYMYYDIDEGKIPGFSTKTFVYNTPLDSCPSSAEFIPQIYINDVLTTLLLSSQVDSDIPCNDGDIPDEHHLECNLDMCELVSGIGDNECVGEGVPGCSAGEEHLECVDNECTVVEGSGDNECSSEGRRCNTGGGGGPGPGPETHNICDYELLQCREVEGSGTDECSTYDDCVIDECEIVDVYWSLEDNGENGGNLDVMEGESVYAIVDTLNCGDGTEIGLELCEYDGFLTECDPEEVPGEVVFSETGDVLNNKVSVEWTTEWFVDEIFFIDTDPEVKFTAYYDEQEFESDNYVKVDEDENHLECQSNQCILVDGPGLDHPDCTSEFDLCDLDPDGPDYPMLQANIFASHEDSEECRKSLSVYSGISRGSLFSSDNPNACGPKGCGFRYPNLQGYGDFEGREYEVGSTGNSRQVLYYGTKEINPDLKVDSHRSISKIEASHFGYGGDHPGEWFADSLSPKWFAYTPLMELQGAVSKDRSENIFKFLKEDVEEMVSWDTEYFPEGLGYPYWEAVDDKEHDWVYLSFFDNDAGAGRGTIEIMAIDYITYDENYAYVHVAYKKDTLSRTIYGKPQSYSMGHNAGLLSASSPSFGSLAFRTNLYCTREREIGECGKLRVEDAQPVMHDRDSTNWIEAAADYAGYFLMQSKYPCPSEGSCPDGTYLNDGVILDADGMDKVTKYGFRFSAPNGDYHLDMNLDGVDDSVSPGLDKMTEDMVDVYQEYFKVIKEEEAPLYGREDNFYIINNGYLLPEYNYPDLNGKRYEDFNGGFQGTYGQAVEQYARTYTDPEFFDWPAFSFISERDRCYYEGFENNCKGEYKYRPELTVNENNNFQVHRDILAMTVVMGDGYYGHDYGHSTGIPACALTVRDDWFDEFSVDDNGISSKHESHDAENICLVVNEVEICVKDRSVHNSWLEKAAGPGYLVEGSVAVYRRDFENGIALVNIGFVDETVDLGGTYYRIIGVDPVDNDNIEDIYNDGSAHIAVTLEPKAGVILLNFEPGLP